MGADERVGQGSGDSGGGEDDDPELQGAWVGVFRQFRIACCLLLGLITGTRESPAQDQWHTGSSLGMREALPADEGDQRGGGDKAGEENEEEDGGEQECVCQGSGVEECGGEPGAVAFEVGDQRGVQRPEYGQGDDDYAGEGGGEFELDAGRLRVRRGKVCWQQAGGEQAAADQPARHGKSESEADG